MPKIDWSELKKDFNPSTLLLPSVFNAASYLETEESEKTLISERVSPERGADWHVSRADASGEKIDRGMGWLAIGFVDEVWLCKALCEFELQFAFFLQM